MTEDVRLDGIGSEGLGRLDKAANACWTASWRTSNENQTRQEEI